MTARPLMLVLAGSMMLVPLALAQDHAVPRGGGGGEAGAGQSSAGFTGGSSSSQPFTGGSSASQPFSGGSWSSQPEPVALFSDHAVARGGSSGSSGSRGGSSGHGGGAVSRSGGSSGSGSSSRARGGSGSSSSQPGPGTTAERRHPRAGTGTGGGYYRGDGRHYPYYGNGYYGGYYYPGWGWGSYWWPYGSYYDGWYGGGYWGYPYGGWVGPRSYMRRDVGSVRVLVNPAEARVYVDGYYAGTVDDFDGLFQRLNVSPGRHEITLKLEGYKTHHVKVYVPFDSTLKLHYNLEKGTGDTFEDQAANVPESELARQRERENELRKEQESEEAERAQESEKEAAPALVTLHLNVTPSDASVYVDGAFRGTAREAASIELPAGRHKLEIVRPGYRTLEREIDVPASEPAEVTIELEKTTV